MGKLAKIFMAFVILIGLVLIGLSLFVHFYLTGDRVRAVVIPRAEKALGRTVQIGGIDVGLFSGITVKDFAVKEPDGKTNFASAKKFVLRYDLLPLLQQRIVISKIELESPYIQVVRDKTGHFNFETLTVLATPPKVTHKGAKKAPPSAALLALTVHQLKIDGAQIVFHDALKELPDTEIGADLNLALQLGRNFKSIRYQGNLHFVADSIYGGLRPHISGNSKFNQDHLAYAVDVDMESEKAHISGEAKNYTKAPDIYLNITSDSIHLDHLLDLVAALPVASQERRPSRGVGAVVPPMAPAAALPPGLKAAGKIKIGQIFYKGLVVKDFLLQYALDKGILNLENLSAGVAGGRIDGKMQADLNRPGLAYKGQIDTNAVKIEGVLASLAPKISNMVSGTLGSQFTFSGTGTEWPRLRNNLGLEGTYSLRNGQIANTPLTMAITRLIGLKELNKLSVKALDGSLHIEKGKVYLKSSMNSKGIRAKANGNVGLDGTLDLPVDLYLSPKLSKKLKRSRSIVKYLASKEGETELRIKLTGTLTHPYPVLNTSGIQRQLENTLRRKATEALQKALTGKKKGKGTKEIEQNTIKGLMKGILGQ
ncbi:MAG: AsmA family protein [Nitrospiraceae bacterium]|nr:AsmA family protein [Nitrospiraceae bacterium]